MIKQAVKMKQKDERPNSLPAVSGRQKQGFLKNASPKQRKIIVGTGITLGLSAIALLIIHFGVKKGKKIISKIEQGKVLSDQHAFWAKQFKIAFLNGGWGAGTIEKIVRETMLEIPSKDDFEKVEKSYARMFNGEVLSTTLEKELSHTEYAEIVAIQNSKPQKAKDAQKGVAIFDPDGWAIRINAGVSYQWLGIGWGTDWEAIKRVILEMKNAGAKRSWEATELEYFQKFATALRADLKGDLNNSQIKWIQDTLRQ